MSRSTRTWGILAAIGVAIMTAAGFATLNGIEDSLAQAIGGSQEENVADGGEVSFRCGYMARQRGIEDPACAELSRPRAPQSVTVTPLPEPPSE